MKSLTLLLCFLAVVNFRFKHCFNQDQLCEHKTDGSGKSKGIVISLQLPCDWKEMETKSSDQVLKYAKKNDETRVVTSADLAITDLPQGLNSSQEQDLLKPDGLKTLSEGSGEIVYNTPHI